MIYIILFIVVFVPVFDLFSKKAVMKFYRNNGRNMGVLSPCVFFMYVFFNKDKEKGFIQKNQTDHHIKFINICPPVYNNGAFLGIFKKRKVLLHFLIGLSLLVLMAFIIYNIYHKDFSAIFLSIVLGGGLGNFIDRLMHKAVTDFLFLSFNKNIIFNIADLFIMIGVVCVMIYIIFT